MCGSFEIIEMPPPAAYRPLPTARCLPPAVYRPLPTARCLPPAAYRCCLPAATHRPPPGSRDGDPPSLPTVSPRLMLGGGTGGGSAPKLLSGTQSMPAPIPLAGRRRSGELLIVEKFSLNGSSGGPVSCICPSRGQCGRKNRINRNASSLLFTSVFIRKPCMGREMKSLGEGGAMRR